MTDFVLHSAERAAEQTINNRAMLIASLRDTQTLVSLLLNPPKPGAVLRRATRYCKKHMDV